jgi:hypothetical protein
MEPTTLKEPGTKRLKRKYDALLSSFALSLNLRCYAEPKIGMEMMRPVLNLNREVKAKQAG